MPLPPSPPTPRGVLAFSFSYHMDTNQDTPDTYQSSPLGSAYIYSPTSWRGTLHSPGKPSMLVCQLYCKVIPQEQTFPDTTSSLRDSLHDWDILCALTSYPSHCSATKLWTGCLLMVDCLSLHGTLLITHASLHLCDLQFLVKLVSQNTFVW